MNNSKPDYSTAVEQAFDTWWNSLTPEQQIVFDYRSCRVGFLGGACHGVAQAQQIIKEHNHAE